RGHRLRECYAVTRRPVEPERRHADHDEPRVACGELLVAQAEVVHDPWREVLHRSVGALEEPRDQLDAGGATQIERDAALPEIDGVEQRAPLPPPLAGGRLDTLEAHPVWALDRLHFDDLRSPRGQVPRRERSGPEGGDIDSP